MSGEFPLHSWVINHSDWIAPRLRLVGVELYIKEARGNADVIFADDKSRTLYVVEAKDGGRELDKARNEAEGYAEAIEEHQSHRKIKPWRVVSVGITIDYGDLRDDKGQLLHHGVLYKRNQPPLMPGEP